MSPSRTPLVVVLAGVLGMSALTGCVLSDESDSERPALHDAASIGALADVERLLDNGADVNERENSGYTPLMESAGIYNDVTAVLIDRGADLDLRQEDGYSAVMLAYGRAEADPEAVRMLIDAGADQSIPSDHPDFDAATLCEQAKIDDTATMVEVLC